MCEYTLVLSIFWYWDIRWIHNLKTKTLLLIADKVSLPVGLMLQSEAVEVCRFTLSSLSVLHTACSRFGMNSSLFVAPRCPASLHLNACEWFVICGRSRFIYPERIDRAAVSSLRAPLLYVPADTSAGTSELITPGDFLASVKHASTSVFPIHSSHLYFLSCLGFRFCLRSLLLLT